MASQRYSVWFGCVLWHINYQVGFDAGPFNCCGSHMNVRPSHKKDVRFLQHSPFWCLSGTTPGSQPCKEGITLGGTVVCWRYKQIGLAYLYLMVDLTDKLKRSFFQTAIDIADMDALHGSLLKCLRKGLTATTQECCMQYWICPGGSTPQSSSCTATYHPSRKLLKFYKLDVQNTPGEVGKSSLVMYPYGPLHMAEKKQGDQLQPTYSCSVRIRDVALGTYRKRWTIRRGGERGSGISVLMARQDDDEMLDTNWFFFG